MRCEGRWEVNGVQTGYITNFLKSPFKLGFFIKDSFA